MSSRRFRIECPTTSHSSTSARRVNVHRERRLGWATAKGNAARRWNAGAGAVVLGVMCLLVVGLCGCAAAQREDGTLIIGVPIGNDPGSASSIGKTVGDVAGLFGVPGAPVIGGLVTSALALLGWGVKKHGDAKAATARYDGERHGWDEASATYQNPPRSAAALPAQQSPGEVSQAQN